MSNHYSAANLRFPATTYAWTSSPTSARPISTQPGNRGGVGT